MVLQAVCWRVTFPDLGYAFIIHLHTHSDVLTMNMQYGFAN